MFSNVPGREAGMNLALAPKAASRVQGTVLSYLHINTIRAEFMLGHFVFIATCEVHTLRALCIDEKPEVQGVDASCLRSRS
jgi:hypothetical protein